MTLENAKVLYKQLMEAGRTADAENILIRYPEAKETYAPEPPAKPEYKKEEAAEEVAKPEVKKHAKGKKR